MDGGSGGEPRRRGFAGGDPAMEVSASVSPSSSSATTTSSTTVIDRSFGVGDSEFPVWGKLKAIVYATSGPRRHWIESELFDLTAMGLSSLPTPSEGMLTLLLVNTALIVSLVKEIVCSILHVLGFRPVPPAPDPTSSGGSAFDGPPEPTITDRFRSRFKPIRFASTYGRRRQQAVDCRVCLAGFEPESVVNRLPCGHLFHKTCLERWLDYHHATCPLCRSHLLPTDEPPSLPPPPPLLRSGISGNYGGCHCAAGSQ